MKNADMAWRRRATRWLIIIFLFYALFPVLFGSLPLLVLQGAVSEQFKRTWLGGDVIAFGVMLAFFYFTGAHERKDKWPEPLERIKELIFDKARERAADFPTLKRTPISKALHDSPSTAIIEGHIALASPGAALIAPISGVPCVGYRVVVQQWHDGRRLSWKTISDRESDAPYVVSDESGHVLIDVHGSADGRDELRRAGSIELEHEISTRAVKYESKVGTQYFLPALCAYVDGHCGGMQGFDYAGRTRVTEAVLLEGEVVTVIGRMTEGPAPVAGYRSEHDAGVPIMDRSATTAVFLTRLEELNWLISAHKKLFVAMIMAGIAGLTIAGSGILILILR